MRLDDKIVDAILSDRCKSIISTFHEVTITLSGVADGIVTTIALRRYTPCCLASIIATRGGDVVLRLDRLPVSGTLCSFADTVARDRQEEMDGSVRDYRAALAHLECLTRT